LRDLSLPTSFVDLGFGRAAKTEPVARFDIPSKASRRRPACPPCVRCADRFRYQQEVLWFPLTIGSEVLWGAVAVSASDSDCTSLGPVYSFCDEAVVAIACTSRACCGGRVPMHCPAIAALADLTGHGRWMDILQNR
jgi:hypothetical protein